MGKRDQATTDVFVEGLRHATRGELQVTTHGFAPYRSAITTTFHDRCDFAQPIKVYHAPQAGEKRYSPAEVASVEVVPVMGRPDPERICTSKVDCSNLSLRMCAGRFTRLTNAFSKEMGEPLGCRRTVVLLLQLLPDSQITAHHASDGSRDR